MVTLLVFFFSSRRRHTRLQGDWSSDVCSSDLRQDEAGGLLPALDEPALDEQAVDAHARRGLGHALHYRRPSRRGRSRNSSTIPVRNPPMCANHAIPPVSPPPSADALTVIRPLTNWTTIQKPSTTSAGTYTNRTKNPKTRSTSTRAYGNRSR